MRVFSFSCNQHLYRMLFHIWTVELERCRANWTKKQINLGVVTSSSIGALARWSSTSGSLLLSLLHLGEEGGVHGHHLLHLLHLEHGDLLLLLQGDLALITTGVALPSVLGVAAALGDAELTPEADHLDLEGIVLPPEHAILLGQALDGALQLLEDLLLAVARLAGRTTVGGEALVALLLVGLGLLVGGDDLVSSALGRGGG
mmetsp:Transcript_19079/g.54989  ORF Transcript_19079/g.54989 Transcript_19079/m.54989 type:complete len:202 (+) Transcript_19079:106-711(+)